MEADNPQPSDQATERELIPIRLVERFAQLMTALEDALSTLTRHDTPSAVHETRVATRRFRVALQNLKHHLPAKERRRCAIALLAIAKRCGAVRDADVRQHLLRTLLTRAGLQHHEQGRRLLLAAVQDRKAASRALRRRLSRLKWSELLLGLRQNAARLILDGFKDSRNGRILEVLERRRRRFLDRLRKRTRSRRHRPLHRLRLRIKDARYLTEDFGPILGVPIEAELAELRDLQKLLGDLHDEWRLKKWLRRQYKCYLVTGALRGLLKSRKRKRLEKIRQLGEVISRRAGRTDRHWRQ
jgi:CHAD domain-containing protein